MLKKVLSVLIVVMMLAGFSTILAQDDIVYRNIKIELDGVLLSPKDANGNPVEPFIKGGFTYLPLRALADALGLSVKWDGDTKTVILGEEKPYQETDDGKVKVYLNGEKLKLDPEAIIISGSTYLPVRGVSESFGKDVDWIDPTSTVVITSPKTESEKEEKEEKEQDGPVEVAKFDTSKTYKIVLKDTDKAITVRDASTENGSNLTLVKFAGAPEQVWKFEAIGENYVLVNVNSQKALDVPGLSTNEGEMLIQWDKSGDINQQFKFVKNADGTISIIAAVSGLYLEGASGDLVQNAKRQSDLQKYVVEEASASGETTKEDSKEETKEDTPTTSTKIEGYYKVISPSGKVLSIDSTDAAAPVIIEEEANKDEQVWKITDNGDGSYTFTNKKSTLLMDVSGESREAGGEIIQWSSTGGENQKWVLVKTNDGKYLIQSRMSQLYLMSTDRSVVQHTESNAFKWELEPVK